MSFTEILNNVPLTWISVSIIAILVAYKLGLAYLKTKNTKKKKYKSHDDVVKFFNNGVQSEIKKINKEIKIIKKFIKGKGKK